MRNRFLPLLLLLFAGSGCAALIYEIVWFQLLQLVIGSSAVSLGVLLGTFMGGMCLGSLALPRIISARRHPLRIYALLELGIGIIGIAILFGMPHLSRLYVANVGHGLPGILLRGLICSIGLLPPTVLMGATLPIIARWVETERQDVSWMGFFYGGNIAGAVVGCLAAGFYLLRVYDMAVASYVAAGINGAVGLIGLVLAGVSPHQQVTHDPLPADARTHPGAWSVYMTIALSGLCALGAEVIWTRLLSLMLGATVYTFAIILAVFLVGLGVGSSVGTLISRSNTRPRNALGICQFLLAAAIAWTAYLLANSVPYWPINPELSSSPWISFQLDLMRCLWAIFPATCLWGASFPLALAAVASRDRDAAQLVGGVYAANTLGAIVGAIAFSVLVINWLGTQQAQRLLIGISALAALLAMAPTMKSAGRVVAALSVISAVFLAYLLVRSVPGVNGDLVAYGRYLPSRRGQAEILYVGEGMNSSVVVSEAANGQRSFHVSGKVEASSDPADMRLQRMLGNIPGLLHPKPRSVLIVGCGAGVTAGSFVLHPDIERIVICEIEPLIPRVVAQYFGEENYHVLRDPRVTVIYDDARHYILTTNDKFDIITSDPIHPWVKGSATLYSKEYFELCRQHLNPGGFITQWVPLYESGLDAVKSEFATFFEVFPHGTVWSNDVNGGGYDIVLLGQAGPTSIVVDALQQRLARAEYSGVARSLQEVGFRTGVALLSTYAGRGTDLGPWLKGAQINRDRNLRLQYLAGMGLNSYRNERIYDDLLRYRKYPEEMFVASEGLGEALRQVLGVAGSHK